MKRTNKSVQDNTNSIKAGFSSINKMVGAIGIGFSATAIVAGLKQIGNEMLAIKDGATQLGTSNKDFQVLQYAAEYSEEAMSSVVTVLNKLDQQLQEATNNGGAAAKMFKDIGVNVSELSKLSAGQRFAAIAQDIKSAEDPGARFSQWASILGEKILPKLKEALGNASVGYAELEANTKKIGIVTDESIRKYDQAVKSLEKLKRTAVVAIAGLLDATPAQLGQNLGMYLMDTTKKVEDFGKGGATAAIRLQHLTNALDSFNANFAGKGKVPASRLAEYKALMASLTDTINKETAAVKAAEDAAAEHAKTLGETKDEIAAINTQYDSSIQKYEALQKLYSSSANTKAQQDVIRAEIQKTSKTMEDEVKRLSESMLTPMQRYNATLAELKQKVALNVAGAKEVLSAFEQTNPAIKEAETATREYNDAMAQTSPALAYAAAIAAVDEQVKKWSDDATIGTQKANEYGAAMKAALAANTPAARFTKDYQEYLQTPEQKRQKQIGDINASNLSDKDKSAAIYDLDTGFVQMQKQLVEQSREIQNQTNQWTELSNAAKTAETEYNSATTIAELTKTKQALDAVQEQYEFMGEVGSRAVESLSAGFARLIVEGGSVKDMLKGVLQMIAELIIQQAILSMVKSMGFGGMFAGGGDVNPNKYYVVGENGPELFSPKARGTIINDTQIAARSSGGGSAPVIQFNLSAYDTQGMSQMIDSKTPAIIAQAMRTWKYENSRGKM